MGWELKGLAQRLRKQVREMKVDRNYKIMLTALTCLALLHSGAAESDSKAKPSDRMIGDAIERTMMFDPTVFSNDVDIEVEEGIVTLKGEVEDLRSKERASEIAGSKKGARSVVNLLSVQNSGLSDYEIQTRVKSALSFDTITRDLPIEANVAKGTVTLTGEVDAWGVKNLAEDVASQVIGVRGVINQLTVTPDPERDSATIKSHIERALRNNLFVDAAFVKTNVADGTVTLTGIVGSFAEKGRAVKLAHVAGVNEVNADKLVVDSWIDTGEVKDSPYAQLSDDDIRDAVKAALAADPRVYSYNPEVQVVDGNVTLRGVVDTVVARIAAERDANETVGVRRVYNYLKVRPGTVVPDSELVTRISDALRLNPYTDRYDVKIESRNGRVTLQGDTETQYEKYKVEEIASGIEGVKSVNNRILVLGQNYPHLRPKTDMQIYEDIVDELRWSAFVDAEQIAVKVDDGVVTLSGMVQNLRQKRAAEVNAEDGGARGIINDIKVIQ